MTGKYMCVTQTQLSNNYHSLREQFFVQFQKFSDSKFQILKNWLLFIDLKLVSP